MKVKVLDLTKEFPRSPKEKLGGHLHLARMIDKARAKRTGTIGEYIYPCPLDQSLLDFFGVNNDAFYKAVEKQDDQAILRWFKENAIPKNQADIENWNRELLNRKPQTDESMKHFLEIRNRIAPHRTDVTTWVDLLDLEEGRI
ncbi:MAG TPA: DUF5069 domain-containing protein [Nitrospiria bacterium]|nr:DUF5069 domain-containing protein [Nitrospiria bacterium]